jgi:hypothetical protein
MPGISIFFQLRRRHTDDHVGQAAPLAIAFRALVLAVHGSAVDPVGRVGRYDERSQVFEPERAVVRVCAAGLVFDIDQHDEVGLEFGFVRVGAARRLGEIDLFAEAGIA